ncbi:MAG: AI-2E family transporter [Candidatus Pacearchaeota archaeon]
MNKKEINKLNFILTIVILIILIIIAYFLTKPLLPSIIMAIILAYICHPIYKKALKILKNKSLTSFIICILFILIFGFVLWFGTKALSDQALEFYRNVRDYNLIEKISDFLTSSIVKNPEMAGYIASTIKIGLLSMGRKIQEIAVGFISNIFWFFLQLFVTFFLMFYFLRDGDKIAEEIYNLLPFKEEIKRRIKIRTSEVTKGVLYGRVLIGIIQGITAGIGYYIFGIKHPLLFTVLSILFAILPFVGAWLVWIPLSINFIIIAGWQLGILHLLYHLIITNQIDNIISPYIVGRTAKIHGGIALVGMVGGMISFGLIGLIVGPLILEYLFIAIDIYRKYYLKQNVS